MRKTYFAGTHRTRHPADTWQAIKPLLDSYGITRVADVTGLDTLGIPVTMAVRPLARTLSVAQGKGVTLDGARVSGAMEAIEAWHGEHALPAPAVRRAPARGLVLPYPVAALEQHPGSLLTDRTVLDWIPARSALDGTPALVPATCVQLGREAHTDWRMHLPSASTNGLASGNTRAEAVTHALYEVIERDVVSDLTDRSNTRQASRIDPASITEPHCRRLLDLLDAACAWVELWHLPNRYGLPVMACYLWREDQPVTLVSGTGAHLDPAVALSRAITEAAQSRLTQITGSREDIPAAVHRPGRTHRGPTTPDRAGEPWDETVCEYRSAAPEHDHEEAQLLAGIVVGVARAEPMVVDLTWGPYARSEFSVVKVVAPGLSYSSRHTVPRPQEAAA
ncbi:YcaO-like family protein [Kitasatospora sp. NPDC004723]|uniref:YcaO-like family protein n=1 Tax=Kitasatospora sp. NPDC004723 TaxID=3154288 RepID=UPI0033A47756